MKNEEIYKEIDSKLKRGEKELVAYAKSRRGKNGKKYKYYAQFIFCEYKERTAESIRGEFIQAGVQFPPSIGNIWNIKAKIMDNINTSKPVKKGVKMCRRCKKRPVKEGNHWFCRVCQEVNNKRARTIDTEQYTGATTYIGA